MSRLVRDYLERAAVKGSLPAPKLGLGPRGAILITDRLSVLNAEALTEAVNNRPTVQSVQDADFFIRAPLNVARVYMHRVTGAYRLGPIGQQSGPRAAGPTPVPGEPVGTIAPTDPYGRREAFRHVCGMVGLRTGTIVTARGPAAHAMYVNVLNTSGGISAPVGYMPYYVHPRGTERETSEFGYILGSKNYNGLAVISEAEDGYTRNYTYEYISGGGVYQDDVGDTPVSQVDYTNANVFQGLFSEAMAARLLAHGLVYSRFTQPSELLGYNWIPLRAFAHGAPNYPAELITDIVPIAGADAPDFLGYWIHNRSNIGCVMTPSSVIAEAIKRSAVSERVTLSQADQSQLNGFVAQMEAEPFLAVSQVLSAGILGRKLQDWHSAGDDIKNSLELQKDPKKTVGDYNRDFTGVRIRSFVGTISLVSSAVKMEARVRVATINSVATEVVEVAPYDTTAWAVYPDATGVLPEGVVLLASTEEDKERLDELLAARNDPLKDRVLIVASDKQTMTVPIFWPGMDTDDEALNYIGFGAYQSKDILSAVVQVALLGKEFRRIDGVPGFDRDSALDAQFDYEGGDASNAEEPPE